MENEATTTTRTTDETTCQICGRNIKSRSGAIANHGYKRPGHGWQTPSCMGAGFRPFETSCDAIPLAIDRMAYEIANIDTCIDTLIDGPAVLTVPAELRYDGIERRASFTVERPDGFEYDADGHFESETYGAILAGRIAREWSDRFDADIFAQFLANRLPEWKQVEVVQATAADRALRNAPKTKPVLTKCGECGIDIFRTPLARKGLCEDHADERSACRDAKEFNWYLDRTAKHYGITTQADAKARFIRLNSAAKTTKVKV